MANFLVASLDGARLVRRVNGPMKAAGVIRAAAEMMTKIVPRTEARGRHCRALQAAWAGPLWCAHVSCNWKAECRDRHEHIFCRRNSPVAIVVQVALRAHPIRRTYEPACR